MIDIQPVHVLFPALRRVCGRFVLEFAIAFAAYDIEEHGKLPSIVPCPGPTIEYCGALAFCFQSTGSGLTCAACALTDSL